MTTYAISDFHLSHRNILTYSPKRLDWSSSAIEDHDQKIIDAWRSVVQPDDVVIFCGDWALGSMVRLRELAAMFTGKIDLLLGNHDRSATSMRSLGCFRSVQYRLDVTVPEVGRVIARHRPQDFTLEDARVGDVLLHGHIHGANRNEPPRDERHAIPADQWIRVKLVDASIEALPTAPAPMELSKLVEHARRGR